LLLELEVHLIFYGRHMDVGGSACLLREMSILHSVQELAMTRTGDHICLTCSITNSSVERTSWSNGRMNIFHLKNSSERLGSEDVDLNMPDRFRAFIGHLCQNILVASHSLAPTSSSRASWGSSQVPIHRSGTCEHPDMEGGFLLALILLSTPW
jgi:hypothetical protein